MSFAGIAFLFVKLASMGGSVALLTMGTDKFYSFKYQPKKKRGVNEDVRTRIEAIKQEVK